MMNVVRGVLFGGRGKVEGMRERMEATDRKINDLLQYIDVALNNVRRVSRARSVPVILGAYFSARGYVNSAL